MNITILNKKAIDDVNEANLRLCDQDELKAIMDKVKVVNSTGNRGYMKGSRNMKFRGDIPADIYYILMRGLPPGHPERELRKQAFFKRFPKFAVESKSKYV